ncbi:hypothetical protein AB0K21_21920 [Streptosporangium sp. NPDC049248]|uniref:hypothetical protein n=1 Tax=Streptosporangium sp. NPDC049248 TaxID=3155651 RepID=UPI00342B5331
MSESLFTREVMNDGGETGRSGVVHYLLQGEHGTVDVMLMSPPEGAAVFWRETGGWHGGGVAYHAPFPYQVGQEPREDLCKFVPGDRCYYDVSYSGAENVVQQWWDVGQDNEVIWRYAEVLYQEFFVDTAPAEHLRDPEELLAELAKLIDDKEAGE